MIVIKILGWITLCAILTMISPLLVIGFLIAVGITRSRS